MLEGNIWYPHIDDLFGPRDRVIEDREDGIQSSAHLSSAVDSNDRPDCLVLYLVEI